MEVCESCHTGYDRDEKIAINNLWDGFAISPGVIGSDVGIVLG